MNFQQLLPILWARRQAALLVLLATVVLTALVSFLMPKQYVATASVVLDIKPDPIGGFVTPGAGSLNFITTQTDILESDRVATRVVRLLRLGQNPEAVASWKDATDGKTPLENYYGQLLQRGLTIKPSRGSNVINLTYTATDPEFAAAVANAYAQAYVDVNVELRVEPARQYVAWFDQRLKGLRGDLEKAQARLSAYQQEKGIVATDDRLDHETARLAALTEQLAEAQGQQADSASRLKFTGNELSPDVMGSPVIQSLKAEIAKAEARLTELGSTLGDNHPQYRQTVAQIAGLNRQLNEEIRRISGNAMATTRLTTQKEEELQQAIDAQKQHVLRLRAERDAIAILAKDVESAQRAYDAVSQRISVTNLESQMQQNDASILSTAVPPDSPARPRILLNLLAALVIGSLLGVGAALGLEKMDQRVRNPADLAVAEGIPVLGTLAAESRRYSLRERIATWMSYLRRKRRPSPPPPAEPSLGKQGA
ncbi:MAG TPA: chain length determinant protein EpsF [Rhodocyclaceae bacterium]|nr:chain length determinant protein EpsF [Rhodocyclaceae bacterium]